jgi:hypothetical protein
MTLRAIFTGVAFLQLFVGLEIFSWPVSRARRQAGALAGEPVNSPMASGRIVGQ